MSPVDREIRKEALSKIFAERRRQNAKWGEQNHDDYVWLAILTEEVGELAQAMLEARFRGSQGTRSSINEELVQVAAVALSWLECQERNNPVVTQWNPYCKKKGTPVVHKTPEHKKKVVAGSGQHQWAPWRGHSVCRRCGFIERADGKNRPCPGVVCVAIRKK